jgi:hypothetical protein
MRLCHGQLQVILTQRIPKTRVLRQKLLFFSFFWILLANSSGYRSHVTFQNVLDLIPALSTVRTGTLSYANDLAGLFMLI